MINLGLTFAKALSLGYQVAVGYVCFTSFFSSIYFLFMGGGPLFSTFTAHAMYILPQKITIFIM